MNLNAIMKLVTGVALVACVGSSIAALTLYRDAKDQQQRLADVDRQLDRMLEELDQGIAQRQALESRLNALTAEKTEAENRTRTLTGELATAKELIDPDYDAVESRIRDQLAREFEAREERLLQDQRTRTARSGVSSLIEQLSQLDDQERMAVMSVQAQYGDFLSRLDATPERREQITQALVDVSRDQAQAMQDLMSQAAQDQNPRELRRELAAIRSTAAVREQLSYYLNEEELALLEQTQSQQPQQFSFRMGTNGDGRALFLQGENIGTDVFRSGNVVVQPLEDGREGRVVIRRFGDDN